MKVAVIGGGWAGLAAAVELVTHGIDVTVFEAGREPGGRAKGATLGGANPRRVDNGQHLLVGAYSATLGMMQRVGVAPDSALLRLPFTVHVPGHFRLALPRLPAPLHTALGLARCQGPRLMDKWRAARFMARLQRQRFRLSDDTTVARWLDAEGQHGPLRRFLWDPLCLAALNTPPVNASAQVFANVLRDTLGGGRTATDLLIPRVELGHVFPHPACTWLREHGATVHLGRRVRHIVRTESGWQVHAGPASSSTPTATGHGAESEFDRLVLATAPQHASTLLPANAHFDALRASLRALNYEPIATAYLQYPAAHHLPAPLLGMAGPTGQWVFDRGQLGGPSGLLAVVLSGHGDWETLDNAALAHTLHSELATVLPTLTPPQSTHVIREHRATFACQPGMQRVGHATADAGLWLAGDHTAGDYPATLEGAVRSGLAAARALLDCPRPSSPRFV